MPGMQLDDATQTLKNELRDHVVGFFMAMAVGSIKRLRFNWDELRLLKSAHYQTYTTLEERNVMSEMEEEIKERLLEFFNADEVATFEPKELLEAVPTTLEEDNLETTEYFLVCERNFGPTKRIGLESNLSNPYCIEISSDML